jgi:Fe-coproporphyrin III synthase
LYQLDPRLGLGFSLDGIGEVHDRVRGVPGAYLRVRRSLEVARALGFADVRFSFTQTRHNQGALAQVYALGRELGLELSATVAHDSSLYFRTPDQAAPEGGCLRRDLAPIIRQELTSFSPKRWARAYFDSGLIEFAEQGRRRLPCRAGRAVFFLDPSGQVYPCPVLNSQMGNLAETSFEELWQGAAAEKARQRVANCRQGCWMVCTVRSAMYRNPAQVLGWIAKHKLRSHLGLDPVGARRALSLQDAQR